MRFQVHTNHFSRTSDRLPSTGGWFSELWVGGWVGGSAGGCVGGSDGWNVGNILAMV